jgi:hypothetical protein
MNLRISFVLQINQPYNRPSVNESAMIFVLEP